MISIQQLNHYYGNHQTLKDVTVNIEPHKITAIIGANGAGKSTLLNVMAGLLQQSSGTVSLDHIDMKTMNRENLSKKISMLKQTQNVDLRISVYDLVSFGRYPYTKGKLTETDHLHIQKAISYLNLDSIKDKYVNQLSGGQQQRAYFAMTLAQDTTYLFLDEPLNNLDIKHAMESMGIIKNLVKDFNKTVVLVLHDLNIVSTFVDNVIALKDGKLISHGSIHEVMTTEHLESVFDHQFEIVEHQGKPHCLYNTWKKELL